MQVTFQHGELSLLPVMLAHLVKAPVGMLRQMLSSEMDI